jgi:dipeptidyl aminopeptidase/acylaminoacyl peptidase
VLTHSPNGVLSYAWSSTGEAIAYTEREPVPDEVAARRARGDDAIVAGENQRHVRLWIEMLDSEERRAITPADRTVWDFAWAPDGRRLAVQTTATPAIDDSYMFRELATVNAAGGGLERVVETPGKLGNVAWSPDGTKLAFVGAVSTNDPLAQSVFVVSAQGEAVNRTPNFGGSVTWLSWVDDQAVVFLANEGTKTTLNRVGSVQAAVQRVGGGGPEIISSVRFDANTRTFAAVASTSSHPNEVHVGSVSGGTVERITHHNARLEDVQLADQETIEWTHPDGTTIEGVLLHPVDEQPGVRYPLAILPHGGPEGISRDGWTTSALYPAQVLAARGYAVLMPNYRGSAGRGVAFSKGDHRDLGGKEFEDVIAGIDFLAGRGLVDVERVGSSGTSYGGYFSAWAGTRHHDRFKAAITFAGISNWMSFTGTTDIPYEMSLVHWDLWWFDDPELAWDRSPLAHVSKDNSPTLVAHGAADERVHGVPTGLVVYPREPHGLRERAHQLDFMHRVIEWLDQYVKNASPTTD